MEEEDKPEAKKDVKNPETEGEAASGKTKSDDKQKEHQDN